MTDNAAKATLKALQDKTIKNFGDLFHMDDIRAVRGEAKFSYVWTNARLYNSDTYKFMSSCYQGNSTGDLVDRLGDYTFTSSFQQVWQMLQYNFTQDQQNQVAAANKASQDQLDVLTSAYTKYIDELPGKTGMQLQNAVLSGILSWSSKGATLYDLQQVANYKTLLDKAPPLAGQVFPYLASYLQAVGKAAMLLDATARSSRIKAIANENINSPSDTNGGLPMGSTYLPGWSIKPATSAEVEAGLANSGSSVSINLSITHNSSSGFSVSVEGQAGVSFFGSWFTGSLSGGGSYDYSKDIANDSTTTITLNFTGVTQMQPIAQEAFEFTNGKGWYDITPIIQARTGDASKEGWIFTSKPNFNFDKNGNFGFANGLIISQLPTLEINYSGSNSSKIQESWSANQNTGFSLFGLLNFSASSKQSGYSNDFKKTSTGFSVTYKPPSPVTLPNPFDRTAYLLGVNLSWPAAPTNGFYEFKEHNVWSISNKLADLSKASGSKATPYGTHVFGNVKITGGRTFSPLSSGDKTIIGLAKQHTGASNFGCCSVGCNNAGVHGVRVAMKGDKVHAYLVPLCDKHSHEHDLRAKPNTVAVMTDRSGL